MDALSEFEKRTKAREFLTEAKNQMRNGEYKKALVSLQESRNLFEDSDIPRYMAECYSQMGDWVQAEQVLSSLIFQGTQDAHIFYLMGFAKHEQNKKDEANPYLEQFLELAKDVSYLRKEVKQVQKMLGKKRFGLF